MFSSVLGLAIHQRLVVGVLGEAEALTLAFDFEGGFGPPTSLTAVYHAEFQMKSLERFVVDLDGWPWDALRRIALGVVIPPVFRLISGEQSSVWISLFLFIGLLAMMRLLLALMRRVLPFSYETKEIWKERRFIAKRYDSYQWQKLFWIGLGLLSHVLFGNGLNRGEWFVTLFCLVGGGAGLYVWRKISVTQVPGMRPASV